MYASQPSRYALRVAVLSVTLVLAALSVTSAPASAVSYDLSVASVEVTQATQTPTNAIPLVARRATAVRATIEISGDAGHLFLGTLRVFVNGAEVTPPGGVSSTGPLLLPLQRNNESGTLNFELPAPTPIVASTNVDFRVDVLALKHFLGDPEANTANNSGVAEDLTAVDRETPFIYFTRIDYTPSGLGPPPLSLVAPGTGDAFVRGILPVDDSDPLLYRETTPLKFDCDPDGDGILSQKDGYCDGKNASEQVHLVDFLKSARQMIVSDGVGANDRTFLYGWIKDNPTTFNGSTGPQVGFGNTQPDLYQRTFAHEVVHWFGPSHNRPPEPRGLDEVGWDVGGRLVGNPPGNNETNRVKPITSPVTGPDFDIMTTGDATVTPAIPPPRTNEAWINTRNYKILLNHCTLGGPLGAERPCPTIFRKKAAVVTGFFLPGGKILLKPVFRFPWKAQLSQARRGRFVAKITDTEGVTTTRRFDAPLPVTERRRRRSKGVFSVTLPVDPSAKISSLQIRNADRTVRLARMRRSKPPRIALVSPRPGAVISEKTRVRWVTDDPDTRKGRLLLEAAYSDDRGRNWVPIGVDIPGRDRGFTFDSSAIRKSAGEGVIRVFVSDGLNTVFDDVNHLTVEQD
jgi:hypothetical protein